MTTKIIE